MAELALLALVVIAAAALARLVLVRDGAVRELDRTVGELHLEVLRSRADVTRELAALSAIFRTPGPRGAFGELLLERLLADNLPAESFAVQHRWSDGTRVDAVVRFGDRLVPIDAKFPLDSYLALAAATTDDERRTRRAELVQQVRRHVDAVARYVVPAEGSIDYAFMYVPSESVFAEVVSSADGALNAYCTERRVIPASPNTLLAYLRVVDLGLRGLAIADGVRDIEARVSQALEEAGRLGDAQRVLGGHLESAQRKHHETAEALGRLESAIEGLARSAARGA